MSNNGNRTHTLRIMKDIREFYIENPTGIYICPEENNVCLIHALIIGPKDTPYENGFFYFVLRFPDEYPLRPPKIALKTTSSGTVRFNPNLYDSGLVCLSILGTFPGPSWSPVQTTLSTLLSIQSLMNEYPYYNEPGFEKQKNQNDPPTQDVKDYNYVITHETLRVAVIGMLRKNSSDASGMPAVLKNKMITYFKMNYQFYEKLAKSNQKYDEKNMRDPYRNRRPETFQYKKLLKEIVELETNITTEDKDNCATYDQVVAKTLLDTNGNGDFFPTNSVADVNDSENLNDYMEESDGSDLYESDNDE